MTYDELMEKYRSKEVFIYGRSVVQIVDRETRYEGNTRHTDFIYHTDRNRRGIISVAHAENRC